jgi:hypothetical protein
LEDLPEMRNAHEPALPLQPGQIQLRPVPVVLHASDKGIEREPYGPQRPPNLRRIPSSLEHAAAVGVVELEFDLKGREVSDGQGPSLPPVAFIGRCDIGGP